MKKVSMGSFGIFRKASIVTGGTSIAQLITFASLPLLSRLYTPQDFGSFAVFSAICWLGAVFATYQLEHAVILPKIEKHALRLTYLIIILGGLFAFFSAIFLLVLSMMGVVSWFGSYPLLASMLYFATVIGISATQSLRAWLIRGAKFRAIAQGAIVTAITTASVAIAAALLFGRDYVSYGLMLAQAVGVIVTAFFFSKYGGWTVGYNSFRLAKLTMLATIRRYYRFGFVLTLSNSIKTGYGRLPTLTVTAAGGTAAAGHFGLVERVISAPTILIAQALGSAYRHHVRREVALRGDMIVLNEFIQMVKWAAILAIPAFSFGVVVAPEIFSVLFGAAWREAGEFAAILLVGEAFVFVLTTVEDTSILANKNKYKLLWHFGQLIVHFGLLALAMIGYGSVILILWLFVVSRALFAIVDLTYFYMVLRRPLTKK